MIGILLPKVSFPPCGTLYFYGLPGMAELSRPWAEMKTGAGGEAGREGPGISLVQFRKHTPGTSRVPRAVSRTGRQSQASHGP